MKRIFRLPFFQPKLFPFREKIPMAKISLDISIRMTYIINENGFHYH